MIALVLALVLVQGAAAPAVPAPAVQAPAVPFSVRVQPDTVTVGEPFTVTVAIRVPRAATVSFPAGPDSTQTVESVDPPVIRAVDDDSGMLRSVTYRVVGWETGRQPVTLAPIDVLDGGIARRVEAHPYVFVASVLPADTALRVPRPALDVLASSRLWWPFALIAAVVVVVAWLAWRRRQRRRRAAAPPPPAIEVAQRALASVEALGLLDGGEPSRYVALHLEALRGYLSMRVPSASRAQTTAELVAVLEQRLMPYAAIAALLAEADQIQFARRPVSGARAREIAREVKAAIDSIEEVFERSAAAAAAVAARSGRRVA
jgi:hypothetical protein